jgi:hypothetical protein
MGRSGAPVKAGPGPRQVKTEALAVDEGRTEDRRVNREPPQDIRAFYRLPLEIGVEYRLLNAGESRPAAGAPWLQGSTENLSGGGLLLRGTIPKLDMISDLLSARASIALRLTLPGDRDGLQLIGRVSWLEGFNVSTGSCRMGVRFLDISEELRERIADYVVRSGSLV